MAEAAQLKLVKRSAQEIAELKDKLSGFVSEFVKLEDEKKAADADFNERLGDLWEEIKAIELLIRDNGDGSENNES